ncbi:hypothetical protein PAHAL_5G418500 [Panicum hallii]|uniref:Uncharacterized protein n=1 Tax=Panicum hallii TaxID=206008 RepID=A0A2T8IMV6_9POAL|nr:hypothetical protein PAHAL_5G418500 [Panicum hallii]
MKLVFNIMDGTKVMPVGCGRGNQRHDWLRIIGTKSPLCALKSCNSLIRTAGTLCNNIPFFSGASVRCSRHTVQRCGYTANNIHGWK